VRFFTDALGRFGTPFEIAAAAAILNLDAAALAG